MGFHGMLIMQLITWVGVLLSAAVAAQLARPANCTNRCGDVDIPFPFGLDTEGCYLNKDFGLKCDHSSGVLRTGEQIVTNISLQQGQLDILMYVGFRCFNKLGGVQDTNKVHLSVPTYTISNTQNVFMAIGCDTHAYLEGFQNGIPFTMGCMSLCQNITNVGQSCSGIGCCQEEIPSGLKNFTLKANSYNHHRSIWSFNPCSYVFVVKKDQFNFSSHYLSSTLKDQTLSMVLDWAIGNETCNKSNNIVCGGNSECYEPNNGYGYRCRCKAGYDGNPYLSDGCQDIKECQDPKLNKCKIPKRCVEREGNHSCSCPKWYRGDGRKDGTGCELKLILVGGPAIGLSISFIGLPVCSSLWVYMIVKQRKLIKRRERFFRQNGGLYLSQMLSQQENCTGTATIFSAEELKKASNNYDENLIIGEGGFGTVYKGFL